MNNHEKQDMDISNALTQDPYRYYMEILVNSLESNRYHEIHTIFKYNHGCYIPPFLFTIEEPDWEKVNDSNLSIDEYMPYLNSERVTNKELFKNELKKKYPYYIKESSDDKKRKNKDTTEQFTSDDIFSKNHKKYIVIFGKTGYGKTDLLYNIIYRIGITLGEAEDFKENKKIPIPIYLPSSFFKNMDQTLIDNIEKLNTMDAFFDELFIKNNTFYNENLRFCIRLLYQQYQKNNNYYLLFLADDPYSLKEKSHIKVFNQLFNLINKSQDNRIFITNYPNKRLWEFVVGITETKKEGNTEETSDSEFYYPEPIKGEDSNYSHRFYFIAPFYYKQIRSRVEALIDKKIIHVPLGLEPKKYSNDRISTPFMKKIYNEEIEIYQLARYPRTLNFLIHISFCKGKELPQTRYQLHKDVTHACLKTRRKERYDISELYFLSILYWIIFTNSGNTYNIFSCSYEILENKILSEDDNKYKEFIFRYCGYRKYKDLYIENKSINSIKRIIEENNYSDFFEKHPNGKEITIKDNFLIPYLICLYVTTFNIDSNTAIENIFKNKNVIMDVKSDILGNILYSSEYNSDLSKIAQIIIAYLKYDREKDSQTKVKYFKENTRLMLKHYGIEKYFNIENTHEIISLALILKSFQSDSIYSQEYNYYLERGDYKEQTSRVLELLLDIVNNKKSIHDIDKTETPIPIKDLNEEYDNFISEIIVNKKTGTIKLTNDKLLSGIIISRNHLSYYEKNREELERALLGKKDIPNTAKLIGLLFSIFRKTEQLASPWKLKSLINNSSSKKLPELWNVFLNNYDPIDYYFAMGQIISHKQNKFDSTRLIKEIIPNKRFPSGISSQRTASAEVWQAIEWQMHDKNIFDDILIQRFYFSLYTLLIITENLICPDNFEDSSETWNTGKFYAYYREYSKKLKSNDDIKSYLYNQGINESSFQSLSDTIKNREYTSLWLSHIARRSFIFMSSSELIDNERTETTKLCREYCTAWFDVIQSKNSPFSAFLSDSLAKKLKSFGIINLSGSWELTWEQIKNFHRWLVEDKEDFISCIFDNNIESEEKRGLLKKLDYLYDKGGSCMFTNVLNDFLGNDYKDVTFIYKKSES